MSDLSMGKWNESDYRKQIATSLEVIERAFEKADPDVIEAEFKLDHLTLINGKDQTKIILSAQPPVRQLWLAASAKGIAVHFSWDQEKMQWLDDKGRGYELYSFLAKLVADTTGGRFFPKFEP